MEYANLIGDKFASALIHRQIAKRFISLIYLLQLAASTALRIYDRRCESLLICCFFTRIQS